MNEKLYYLKDGDEIVFIENPFDNTKNIVKKDLAQIRYNCKLLDDDNFPIFKELRKLEFQLRGTKKQLNIAFTTRYLSYIIVNNEVKLTWFGHTIFSKLNAKVVCEIDYLNKKFKIVKNITEGYPSFKNCYFTDEVITYDKMIINEAKPISEYNFNIYNWTFKENKEKLINFLKRNNQENFIPQLINKNRLEKLNRICNET